MAISQVPPLSYNVPIVYPKGHPSEGCPTPAFQALIQILLEEKAVTDALAEGAAVAGDAAASGLTAAATTILGNKEATTGAIEELTLSQVLDLIGSAAQGDILYRGASGWARLAAGTSGQFLKTQGAGANPVWAAASGGGGGSTPTVRSSSCTSLASVSSTSVAWPTGTVAGDVVVIFGGHGFGVNTPTGWTTLDSSTGNNWNGAVFAKVMTAADITAGSVTVTFTGAYNGVVAAVTITGTTVQTFVKAGATRSSTGATSAQEVCTFTNSTDLVLCFASTRANTTCDVTNAAAVALSSSTGANASGDVESLSGASDVFGTTVNNTFGASGTGYYVVAVAFRG